MLDTEEIAPSPPPLQPADFERMRREVAAGGPRAAADWLCEKLETAGDYPALFYALLMRVRIELGVSPFPAGPSSDLPPEHHDLYEEAIRAAGRRVGNLFLAKNDFLHAWTYFNMLGEPQPVLDALNAYQPGPDDEIQPLIELALHHGANVPKGFDLVLDRYGICNAITTFGGLDFSKIPGAKDHCIRALVNALYGQLSERIRNDIESRGEAVPADSTIAEMIAGRDELFAENAYHVDTSHLASVVQFSMDLEAGRELDRAAELAEYGSRLSESYRMDLDPPFEGGYADYRIFLDALRGAGVEAGLEHFRAKIEPAFAEGSTLPAEIFVNLLLRMNRADEALAVAKRYLANVQGRPMACPGVYELCLQAKDFAGLAEAAKGRADGVSFLAALAAK